VSFEIHNFEFARKSEPLTRCWERKWKLTHIPLLTITYIMVTRRQIGRNVNSYALAHIHAHQYVCQHPHDPGMYEPYVSPEDKGKRIAKVTPTPT
jgi:hypothetical protein